MKDIQARINICIARAQVSNKPIINRFGKKEMYDKFYDHIGAAQLVSDLARKNEYLAIAEQVLDEVGL